EPERAKPILAKAEQASKSVERLTIYIDSLQQELSREGGGIRESTGDLHKRKNTSISTRVMIKQGHATRLRNLIDATREELRAISGNEVPFSLEANDPPARGGIPKTWEQANFGGGIPLTAAITSLEKIKADVK